MTKPAVQQRLRQLIEAAPEAWRQDRVFWGATIGVGITGALLLLRLAGPHAHPPPQPVASTLAPAPLPDMAGARNSLVVPVPGQPPAEVPRIAPGQPLGVVTVIPSPDGDRFGTITSGKPP